MSAFYYVGVALFVFGVCGVALLLILETEDKIDLIGGNNEIIVVRTHICRCWKDRSVITPLSEITKFDYNDVNVVKKLKISMRDGSKFLLDFPIPIAEVRHLEAILKRVNPAIINTTPSQFPRIFDEPTPYHTSTTPLVPASSSTYHTDTDIPVLVSSSTYHTGTTTPVPASSTIDLTASQLGIVIQSLQAQQQLLLQGQQQRAQVQVSDQTQIYAHAQAQAGAQTLPGTPAFYSYPSPPHTLPSDYAHTAYGEGQGGGEKEEKFWM